jgi:hypothetical protein
LIIRWFIYDHLKWKWLNHLTLDLWLILADPKVSQVGKHHWLTQIAGFLVANLWLKGDRKMDIWIVCLGLGHVWRCMSVKEHQQYCDVISDPLGCIVYWSILEDENGFPKFKLSKLIALQSPLGWCLVGGLY